MTGDALLDLFQLETPEVGVFRVGQYSPVSIRDQVVRAAYLMERLWAKGWLTEDTKLLVVGAGAAGVTAALEAVDLGVVNIVVADLSDRALTLQAPCTSRWLDPTQYDWPAHHWADSVWPITELANRALPPVQHPYRTAQSLPPPVALKAGTATAWSSDFDRPFSFRHVKGDIDFKPWTKVTSWTPTGGSPRFTVDLVGCRPGYPALKSTIDVDIIIFAGGLGQERTRVPMFSTSHSYVGPDFWSLDKLEDLDFGLGSVPNGVLVSGTGDGSLQDYVRLVSGKKSAREVWDALVAVLPSAWLSELSSLCHWEDHSRRSAAFAPEFFDACEHLERLHWRYQNLVERLLKTKDWNAVETALDALIGTRPADKVFIAQKGTHFDSCYPLNRIVTLFLVEHLRTAKGHSAVLPEVAVKAASLPSGVATADVLWGTAVNALLAHGVSCTHTHVDITSWPKSKTMPKLYDGLVIRHGIDPATLTVKAKKLKPQIVPLHLP